MKVSWLLNLYIYSLSYLFLQSDSFQKHWLHTTVLIFIFIKTRALRNGGLKDANLPSKTNFSLTYIYILCPGLRIRIRGFCMDPDPVSKFPWIRIRFSNFSRSGSGASPDSGTKKIAERSLKVIYQKKT